MADEERVIAVEHAIFEALKAQDPRALAHVLAPEFVYRTPGAEDVARDEFVKSATSLGGKILSITSEGMKCHVFGDTAVLTGVQVANVLLDGAEAAITDRSMFTDVLVHRNGEWLLVLAHCTSLSS